MPTTSKTKQTLVNTWNGRKDSIYVLYETDRGRLSPKKIDVQWFFGIKASDYEKAKEVVRNNRLKLSAIRDPKYPGFIKIIVKEIDSHAIQFDRYAVVLLFEESGIPTYEGDLPPDRRWYIDQDLDICKNLSKLYFDIETDDSKAVIEIGGERIVSFAAVDQDGKKFFTKLDEMTDEAEARMLIKILRLVCKYDILLGWNSREFDIPYLKARMRRYDLHKTKYYKWREVANFDLLKRFRHVYGFNTAIRSFSLEFVSQHFLGHGKIKHEKQRIIDLYHNDPELLKKYNLEDCLLVKELDEKLGVSSLMILQSNWCGVPASDFGVYSTLDGFILRIAHHVGRFEPTSVTAIKEKIKKQKKYNEESQGNFSRESPDVTDTLKKKYLGGLVLDPESGFYDHVYVFDFKSLYPSIMKTGNIGRDTLLYEDDGTCIINPGTQVLNRKSGPVVPTFFQQEHGTIYFVISEIMAKRKEYKAKRIELIEQHKNQGPEWETAVSNDNAVKVIANSIYGIMGLEYGRYFNVDVAESITLFGQWMILNAKKFFESKGHKVIYGDTDSVFVAAKEKIDIDTILAEYHAFLSKELKSQYRIQDHVIELEYDKEYDGFILITKKTYCGLVSTYEGKKVDEVYSRGVEFAKRGTFGFASEKQRELVDMILRKKPATGKIKKWLVDVKTEFYHRDFDKEELAISTKVGKELSHYDKPRKKKEVAKVIDNGQTNMFSEETGTKVAVVEKEKKKNTLPLHVRIAKKIKEKTGEFYRNTEVEYIVTSHDEMLDGVHIDDFDGTWSRDYYWENKTLPLLKRVIEVTHPKIDFETMFNTKTVDLFTNENKK